MRVADLMSTDLATVPSTATLRDAVGVMLERRVGSVIVHDDGVPAGILTETDALRGAHQAGEPFDAIDVAAVMSSSVVTIDPDASEHTAVRRMREEGIKKLVVVEGTTLRGILTTTDLAAHLPDHADELRRIEREREKWTA